MGLEEILIRKKGRFETSRAPKMPEQSEQFTERDLTEEYLKAQDEEPLPELVFQAEAEPGYEPAAQPEEIQTEQVQPEEIPTEDAPIEEAPNEEAPAEEIPSEEIPVADIPVLDETDEKPAGKKKVSPVGKTFIVLGSIVAALALAVCGYGFYLMSTDTVFSNVYVAGVNVGGLKRAAAIAQVADIISTDNQDSTLTVVLPDRKLVLTPDITNVALNPEGAIDAAMRYGRDGGPIRAIRVYYASKKSEHTINLESSLNLNTDAIHAAIEQTAAEAEHALLDPVVTFDEKEKTITVITGSPEIHLDVEGLYNAVLARFGENNYSDLRYEYQTVPCAPVDLQSYYDEYCTDMVDAHYDEETHELVKEEKGFGFDLEEYTQKIATAKPETEIVIRMQDMIPKMTLEELQKTYFATALASYDSPHVVNSNRTNNLTLACKAINGTILNPGEEFSFNDTVGERTQAKGYLPAIVYLEGGASEPENGGGICQVASTIYECCLYANLEVTERTEHMFDVTYVDPGQDATIYWGSLDFKFKNTANYPIRIDASVSNGYVHIKLMGTEEEHDYDHIKITAETYAVKNWGTVGVLSKGSKDAISITIKDGVATDKDGNTYKVLDTINTAYTGKSVTTYRHFMDKNDKEIRSEKLAKSVYEKRDKKVLLEKIQTEEKTNSEDYDENGNYIGDPSKQPDAQQPVNPQQPVNDPTVPQLPTEWQTNPTQPAQNPNDPQFWN